MLKAYKKFISKKGGGKYANISEFKTIKISNGNLTGGSLEDNQDKSLKDNQDKSLITNFLDTIKNVGNDLINFLNEDDSDNKYQEAKNIAEKLIKKVKNRDEEDVKKNDYKLINYYDDNKKTYENEKNNVEEEQVENNNQEEEQVEEQVENNNQEVENNNEAEEIFLKLQGKKYSKTGTIGVINNFKN